MAAESGELDQIAQNIAAVQGFYESEGHKISASQRLTERVSDWVGQPAFLGGVLAFVALWMGLNAIWRGFDPPPHAWLQGLVALGSLLISAVVLSKQNRMARLAEQRARLDLKVNLLTEQMAAKLIELIEELRRDLPQVRDRHDSGAVALQQSLSPGLVLEALAAVEPQAISAA